MPETDQTEEQLLEIYNEIDAFLRRECVRDKYAEHSFLIQELATSNRLVARYQQELRALAQLRNCLVHNPFAAFARPIARPHEAVIKRYSEIRDALLNPRPALSIAVPAAKIFTASPGSSLNSVLKAMDEHIYTHVPILEDDKMTGLFSENTLLSYLADNSETIITDDMTIADFAAYLPLKSHRGESFAFLPRQASLGEVHDVFAQAIHEHRRIGILFITEHGREQEKPLGIITAWDLAAPELGAS